VARPQRRLAKGPGFRLNHPETPPRPQTGRGGTQGGLGGTQGGLGGPKPTGSGRAGVHPHPQAPYRPRLERLRGPQLPPTGVVSWGGLSPRRSRGWGGSAPPRAAFLGSARGGRGAWGPRGPPVAPHDLSLPTAAAAAMSAESAVPVEDGHEVKVRGARRLGEGAAGSAGGSPPCPLPGQSVGSRVASLPLVSSACGMVSAAYACTKESHPYVQSVCDAAEKGVKTLAVAAVSGAQPILTKLEPQSEWGWGWDGGHPQSFGVPENRPWQHPQSFGVPENRPWQHPQSLEVPENQPWQHPQSPGVPKNQPWQHPQSFGVPKNRPWQHPQSPGVPENQPWQHPQSLEVPKNQPGSTPRALGCLKTNLAAPPEPWGAQKPALAAPPEPWGARKPALAEPSRGSGVGMVGFWRLEFILPTNTRGKGWRSWVGAAPHEFWGAGKLALAERLHSSGVGRSWFLISSFHH